MHQLEFHVRLEAEADCLPEVRAWIDLQPDAGLGSETELCLRRAPLNTWVGSFATPLSSAGYFLYRIGLVAHPGALWSLRIRQTHDDREVLSDGDVAPLAKSWLVGTCPLPGLAGCSAPAEAIDTTALRAASATLHRNGLILVRGEYASVTGSSYSQRPAMSVVSAKRAGTRFKDPESR